MILAFYPGDFTPVCTKQFCSYRDDGDRIEALGVPMMGISPQSVESHERFADRHGLTVPLLSDPGKKVRARLRRARARRLHPPGGVPGRRRGCAALPARRPLRSALPGRRRPGAGRGRAVLSMAETLEPQRLRDGRRGTCGSRARRWGRGHPSILLHGLTATRRYVLHGSLALARRGYRQISYDARGHGESRRRRRASGYAYEELTAISGRWRESALPMPRRSWSGHSMGCHTAVAHALEHAGEVAALVLAGPVVLGLPATEETLAYWDALADGLEQGGVDGLHGGLRGLSRG